MAVITLLTDFGLQDEFVGVVHGVILGRCPAARIVDLCHAVPPGDCRRAAYLLHWAYRYFPPGTIHVIIVDPGVGTGRRVLCARAHGQRFLAPDNGVLTTVLQRAHRPVVHEVRNPRYWLPSVHATFHGRDLFAPVAAHLALGVRPEALGPRTARWVRLALPRVRRQGRRWSGTVVDIDRFGNLVTNVEAAVIRASARRPAQLRLHVNRRIIRGLVRTYGDVRRGALTAMVGSRGLVEIAVREGSAARALAARVGDPVALDC